jgi:hypothetical protein
VGVKLNDDHGCAVAHPRLGSRRREFDSERTLEGGDLVVDIGKIIRAGDMQARYVVVHRRQTDGSLKLVADIVLPGA